METFTIEDLERDLAPMPETFTVDDLNADLAAGPSTATGNQTFTIEDLNRDLAGGAAPARTKQPGPFAGVYAPDEIDLAPPAAPSPAGYVPIPAPVHPEGFDPSIVASTARAVPRGAIETAATALEAPALARRGFQDVMAGFDRRMRGAARLTPDQFRRFEQDVLTANLPPLLGTQILNAADRIRAGGMRPEDAPNFTAEGNVAQAAKEAATGFARETFPIPAAHEKRLPVQVARGVGSTAAFVGSRLLPGGQVLLPTMAGLIGSGEAIERAIASGASDEEAARAGLMGVAPGLTDIIPIERLLKPVMKIPGVKGALYAVARKAVEQGLIEGTQEAIQQFMQNAIAQVTSLTEQDITEGIAQNGLVGFIVGMLFGGAAGGAGVASKPTEPIVLEPRPAPEPLVGEEAPGPAQAPPGPETPPQTPTGTAPVPPAMPEPPVVPTPAPTSLPPDIPNKIFRGEGRGSRGKAYTGAAVPILGEGRYFAFSRKDAERFGPNVQEKTIDLKAPLIIRSGEEWRALTNDAGWRFPNLFGLPEKTVKTNTTALNKILRERGHDGVIVWWNQNIKEDIGPAGENIKLLRNVFGTPQVFELGGKKPIAPAPARGPFKPTDQNMKFVLGQVERGRFAGLSAQAREWLAQNGAVEGPGTAPVLSRHGEDLLGKLRAAEPAKAPRKVSRAVPRTRADLERMLDRADAERNRGGVSAKVKAEAARLQQDTLNEISDAIARIQATDYGRSWAESYRHATEGLEWKGKRALDWADSSAQGDIPPDVEFTLRTARGKETHFKVPAKPGALIALRERLAKKTAVGKFASVDLDAADRIVSSATAAGVVTEGRDVSEIADDLGQRSRSGIEEAPPEIVPRVGPATTPTAGRVEIYDSSGIIVTLPTRRPLEEARPLAENVARARGPSTNWRYVDNETGETLHDETMESFTVEDLEADMAAPGPRAMPGAQYTGFVEDAAGADVAPEGEPIRREDILRPLTEALGAPLYQGRIGGKKRLGFYRPHLEEVRIKRMSDIETAAHEMAHLLDDRIPEIRAQWYPATKANKEVREELRGVSYDRTKLYEGWAEFVRLWSTQKEEAKAKAPRVYGWFEDFVARSEYGPALRQAQEGMHAWFRQDALLRAKSKIGVAEDINAGLQGTIGDRFRQSVADDLHGIFRMELDLTGEIAPVGAYETARLTRGAHAMAEGALTFGVPVVNADGSHSFVGKGLQQILEPVAKNLDDFLTYAVGRSARELRNQGRENLFTRAEVKAMVALETPEFKTAFQEYQDWNKGILDFAQAKGLIGGLDRAKWRRAEYIPFHRVGQSTAGETGTSGEWKGIKALTGGTGNLKDILGNIINNSVTLIDAALKNEARLEVAQLAHRRGGAHFMTKIPKEDKRIAIPTHEVRRVFLKALGVRSTANLPPDVRRYLDAAFEEMAPFAKFLMYGQAPYGDNVVAVLKNGKPLYFEVADTLLLRSLTHLNRPGRHWFVKLLNVPKRVSQGTITLAFDFMGANLARDTLMGGIMSRHGFKPLLDSARGLKSRITSDPTYRDFIANGGGFSSFLLDEDAMRRQMQRLSRFYKRKGIDYRTVLDTPDKILTALEHLSSAIEMSTRIGEYRRAIAKGEHPRHAAYSGREVSVDFAMRGDLDALGWFYDTVIFLKAGVNGMDRLYRGFAKDPNKRAIAARAAMLAAMSAALSALNSDNPLYDELEDWNRDGHWHFFIPNSEYFDFVEREGRKPQTKKEAEPLYYHFKWPKIWEIGGMASIAERQWEGIAKSIAEESGMPLWEAQKHTGRIIMDLFRLEYIPQAIAPLAEVYAYNRNRFTTRPVETEAMKDLQPWARAGPYTSRALRELGEATRHLPRALQISPARAEALVRGYLNTWGMYGLSMVDAMAFDDKADMRFDRYPVVRRFFQQHPSSQSRYVRELYDALREATEARRTMRQMAKSYRPEIAEELKYTPENAAYNQLTAANKHMRTVSRQIAQVAWAKSLPDVQRIVDARARATRRPGLLLELHSKGTWQDIGALKSWLRDDLVGERNRYARAVVKDMAGRKGKTGRR